MKEKGIIGLIALIIGGLFMLTIFNTNNKKAVSINYDKKIQTAQARLVSIDMDLSDDFYLEGTKQEKTERKAELKEEKRVLKERIAKWQKHEDSTDIALAPPKPAQAKPANQTDKPGKVEKTDNLKKLGGI